MSALNRIRARFDDGGAVETLPDYTATAQSTANDTPYDPGAFNDLWGPDTNSNSGMPSAGDVAALTAPTTSNPIQYNGGLQPGTYTPSSPAPGSAGAGIQKLLSSLGLGGKNTSNTALLNAAVGVLSAIGNYKQNAAGSKLPAMPALGALPALPGSQTSGYGPGQGYGYQNYAQASTGLGYAPRTQSKPTPSYFTYGQGPATQFFQQVQPTGGAISPVSGGFAAGGPVPGLGMVPMRPQTQPGFTSQPGQLARGALGAMNPRPWTHGPAAPSTMTQRMQVARGFSHGGVPGGNAGVSRHVTGPGDGTSDSIPARLSSGEYVIDAQAVSMLGNGDNSAGAKKLDDFRASLRRHKGGALSRGKMAPPSKQVHQYMGGK